MIHAAVLSEGVYMTLPESAAVFLWQNIGLVTENHISSILILYDIAHSEISSLFKIKPSCQIILDKYVLVCDIFRCLCW